MKTAEQRYLKETAAWVSSMGDTLMHVLGEYFDRSFQVQVDALIHLDGLLTEKKEHDERLGGYIEFDKGVEIETYQKIVQDAKEADTIVINKLQALWKNRVDGSPALFAFAELDRTLTGAFKEQWNQIKEPLRQVGRWYFASGGNCTMTWLTLLLRRQSMLPLPAQPIQRTVVTNK
jgi:hypothetical protein